MKMLKYLNKRIFICLSLALVILIVASFVASLAEEEKGGKGGAVLFQNPMGPVTKEDNITFSWNVTQPSQSFYSGKYCVLIERPSKEPIILKKDTIPSDKDFSGYYYPDWEVPDERGWYTAYIRVPCERDDIKGQVTSSTSFKVVKTVLVIQKYKDTNQNNKVDIGVDERLQDWEFQVTDPDMNRYTRFTDVNGEIRIEVPEKYDGKDYKIEEKGRPDWKLIKKDTNALIAGEGKQWIKITVEKDKESKVTFLNKEVTTILIQKFEDTNRNYEIDNGDKKLGDLEFNVTNPAGETRSYKTNNYGEILIDIPGGEEGDYDITETPNEYELIKKDTAKTALILGQGEQWIKIRVEEGKQSKVRFLNNKSEDTRLVIQKFNDTNRNREIDNIDESLRNWEYAVTNPAGETRSYKTNTYGEILIDIPKGKEGDYKIVEIIKELGWKLIKKDTDKTAPILDQGEQWIKINVERGKESKVRFLNYLPSQRLVISKFYDHNLNGKRDGREEGLGNWEFEIKSPDGSVKNVPTEPDGRIIIDNPTIGTYTITELTTKPCWNSSSPIEQKVEIKPGQGAEVEFGNYEVGTLSIHKFNDTNHNANWDAGEVPLSNWGFRVKDPKGFIDISGYEHLTDDNGSITLELPANIKYIVTDTFLVGWRNSTSSMQYANIKPCEDTNVYFGNYMNTPIVIHKFNDTNKDGNIDNGEEGLAGWDFRIKGPGVDKIITTNEKGDARFDDAIPGLYRIEEIINERWLPTTPLIREDLEVEEGKKVIVEFGNRLIGDPCEEYGIYMRPEDAPRWHNRSDGYLTVSKYIDPRIVHCDNPNPDKGEKIDVTLRVCVLPVMKPTDLVIAVDTSGSLIEQGGKVLEVMKDGIIEYIENNKARFGENVRIGLVSWDEDIDETVNLTTDYSKMKAACTRLSSNAEEDTLYLVGLNGSIEVFARTPRKNVTKVIVFVTDAKGTSDDLSGYSPDTSAYVMHAITVGPIQNKETMTMLENFTHQPVKEVTESSEELAEALTTLTVSSIERRTLNNVTVVETLPKYMRALKGGYEIQPTSVHINPDGLKWNTETIKWGIGDLSSSECWENTFEVLFCCRVPVDVTQPDGISTVTSEVSYSDPTNSTITRHLLIPEGGLWIEPPQVPKGLLEKIREVPGFEALFAIAGLLAVGYMMWRRKK